jgi:hypothetical protein
VNDDLFEITTNADGYLEIDGYVVRRVVESPDWYDVRAEDDHYDDRMKKVWRTLADAIRKNNEDHRRYNEDALFFRQSPEAAFVALQRQVEALQKTVDELQGKAENS